MPACTCSSLFLNGARSFTTGRHPVSGTTFLLPVELPPPPHPRPPRPNEKRLCLPRCPLARGRRGRTATDPMKALGSITTWIYYGGLRGGHHQGRGSGPRTPQPGDRSCSHGVPFPESSAWGTVLESGARPAKFQQQAAGLLISTKKDETSQTDGCRSREDTCK